MDKKSYLGTYKKIGPIVIEIKERSARVLSVLGIKKYDYKLLPKNYDNRYAIISFSMKNYFGDFIKENKFKGSDAKENNSKLSSTAFKYFFNFFLPTAFQNGTRSDFKNEIFIDMEKNPRNYNWENIEGFRLCVLTSSPLEGLKTPILINFSKFNEDFFINREMLKVTDKDFTILKSKTRFKNFEISQSEYIGRFLNNEIEYFSKLLNYNIDLNMYKNKIVFSDMSCFFDILSSQENFIIKLFENFGNNFLKIIGKEKLLIIKEKSVRIGNLLNNQGGFACKALNIENICRFILENFILFVPYIEFMSKYEELLEKYRNYSIIRGCFSEIIQKITNFSFIFKYLLKYYDNELLQLVYLKTEKYSKMLHNIANSTYLENELKRLYNYSSNFIDLFKDFEISNIEKLYGKAVCNSLEDKIIYLYIFDDYIGIFDRNYVCLNIILLKNIDINIFNMRIFLFVNLISFKSDIFKRSEYFDFNYLILKITSKESILEFKDIFYSRKYNAKIYENITSNNKECIYYSQKEDNQNVLNITKLKKNNLERNTVNDSEKSLKNILENLTIKKSTISNIAIPNVSNRANTVTNTVTNIYTNTVTNTVTNTATNTNNTATNTNNTSNNTNNTATNTNNTATNGNTIYNYLKDESGKISFINFQKIEKVNKKQKSTSIKITDSDSKNKEIKSRNMNKNNSYTGIIVRGNMKIFTAFLLQRYLDIFIKDCKEVKKYLLRSRLKLRKKKPADLKQCSYKIKLESFDPIKTFVLEVNEEKMIDIIKNFSNEQIKKNYIDPNFLGKLKLFLGSIPTNKLYEFELYAYNEELVKYEEKVKIFDIFCKILKLKSKDQLSGKKIFSATEEKMDDFYANILYEDDVLKEIDEKDLVLYLKEYLMILHNYKQADAILSSLAVESCVILFSMFLQRNIYNFFSPREISIIENEFDKEKFPTELIQNIFIQKIFDILVSVYYANNKLGRLIIYTFYRKKNFDKSLFNLFKNFKIA